MEPAKDLGTRTFMDEDGYKLVVHHMPSWPALGLVHVRTDALHGAYLSRAQVQGLVERLVAILHA